MLQNLTGWHSLIILAVVVLIFGAAKLPALAKSVGQSVRILKKEVADPSADRADERSDDEAAETAPRTTVTPVADTSVLPTPIAGRSAS